MMLWSRRNGAAVFRCSRRVKKTVVLQYGACSQADVCKGSGNIWEHLPRFLRHTWDSIESNLELNGNAASRHIDGRW